MIHLKNISTLWFLLISSICYNKTILFQLVAFKIHAIIKTAYCVNWLPWTSSGSSHWEVFLEIDLNQKTLKFYTSRMHWKNQCRSTIRKHAVMEQAWMSTVTYLLKISLTHFMALKNIRDCLMFSGDIERDQCHEMG